MFTSIVVSVVADVGRGWASLPTANRFWFSSYKPTVDTYGEKYEPVTLFASCPLPLNWAEGFNVALNSFSRIVHLYCASYIV